MNGSKNSPNFKEDKINVTKIYGCRSKISPKLVPSPKQFLRSEFFETINNEPKKINELQHNQQKNDIRHLSVDQINLSSEQQIQENPDTQHLIYQNIDSQYKVSTALFPKIINQFSKTHRLNDNSKKVKRKNVINNSQFKTLMSKTANSIIFQIKLQDDTIQSSKESTPKTNPQSNLFRQSTKEDQEQRDTLAIRIHNHHQYFFPKKGSSTKRLQINDSLVTSMKPIHFHFQARQAHNDSDLNGTRQQQASQSHTTIIEIERSPVKKKADFFQSHVKGKIMELQLKRVQLPKQKGDMFSKPYGSIVGHNALICTSIIETSSRSDTSPQRSASNRDNSIQMRYQTAQGVKKNRDVCYYQDQKFPRDHQFQERYATLRTFYSILNLANNLYISEPIGQGQVYKAYIGKGNNASLVRQIIKSRWWWSISEIKDIETANFVWTQLRNQKYLRNLKNLKKEPETPKNCSEQDYQKQQIQMNQIQNKISSDYRKIMNSQDFGIVTNSLNLINQPKYKILSYQNVKQLQLGGKIIKHYSDPQNNKCHNHLENNFHLGNKKALFYNMRAYYESCRKDVFQSLPLTFHIKNAKDDPEYIKFVEAFKQRQDQQQQKNIWIIKPGELTNRGHGIRVSANLREISDILNSREIHKNGNYKTYIVQQYLSKPLLYNKRKFDIRCYMLFTSVNQCQRGYWYKEGYIRTSSKEFSNKNLTSKMIHLTNDAVQKKGDDYGRYEKGNKVSFEEFQKYLENENSSSDFWRDIYPQMRNLARDAIRATYAKLDPNQKENTIELFGLDFMIDDSFHVWLIEVNTNPCLELSSPLLARLLPNMLDNLFRLTLDPLFPPPHFYNPKRFPYDNPLEQNGFELIFDELEDANGIEPAKDLNIDYIAEEEEEDEEEMDNE